MGKWRMGRGSKGRRGEKWEAREKKKNGRERKERRGEGRDKEGEMQEFIVRNTLIRLEIGENLEN